MSLRVLWHSQRLSLLGVSLLKLTQRDHLNTKSDNLKFAVLVIVLTVLMLSLGDAIIKTLSSNLVLWQIFVLRSLVAIPLLYVIVRARYKDIKFSPIAIKWTVARSIMLVLMWVFYYLSLPHLQLSVAAASYYTLPIFITIFSAILVKEPISIRGWIAVLIGFIGTLLIIKPVPSEFNAYALLPLVSAMLYALAMILTRTKCRNENPLVLSMALNVTFITVGLIATVLGQLFFNNENPSSFISTRWTAMGLNEVLAIGLLGIAILVASIGTAFAYQNGKSSTIATFDFSYVGFAVIWGALFFSELPDLPSLCGMGLIVFAGIMAVQE